MKKNLSIVLLLAVVTVAATVSYAYQSFRSDKLAELAAGSQVIATRAGAIEYVLSGEGEGVVLFLHGTPGGYDQHIAVEGWQVLAPSRPGYLRTPVSVGKTPLQQAQSYTALLDALGIDKVVALGASGGGPSAMAFAATYPERTHALIAVEAVSHSDLPDIKVPWFLNYDFSAWVVMGALQQVFGVDGLVKTMVPDPQNHQLILNNADKVASFSRLVWTTWPPSLRAAGLHNDTQELAVLDLPLHQIEVPTLVVHGTADRNVPIAHADYLSDRVPHAQAFIVDSADHMMPITHQEQIAGAIGAFLGQFE